jgi:uncharacterized secreted protein with C-terminal beta-propeller domain
MLNHRNKGLLLLASSLLFNVAAQPIFAATAATTVAKPVVSKLKPQKITSRLTLANLLMKHKTNRFYRYPYYYENDMAAPVMADGSIIGKVGGISSSDAGATPTTSPISHSDTNIQVAGVDESDIVKVGDDGYIYQIHNGVIRVVKGHPVVELTQTADIVLPDTNFTPSGIYIQEGKLVVVGSAWQTLEQPALTSKMAYNYCCWWGGYSQTRALVYDVSDHANPKQIRDVAIDGDYLDSRRIGDNLYFVTRSYPRYYMYGDVSSTTIKAADMLPSIVENKAGKTTTRLMNVADVSYFPDFIEPDYVVVASLNLAQPDKAVTTKAYLGSGELVYASMQNLYLSAAKYNFGGSSDIAPTQNNVSTQIYKFGIDKGAVTFAAVGEVDGTALNQFSMDENGDYFRIATTTQSWYSGTSESHNSLFVLNKDMATVGKLENLAKGEQIYSTRFMGNRCFIVTFKLTDPLFAIDLSTPENPFVAGELKIPGYSNYLHPYDENHLIGFGKDAAIYEKEQGGADEWWSGGSAFYQGLKMALFDISDMASPKEMYTVTIGDRGTNSPLLYNHKALYWDAEKHLFGFPVEVYQLPKGFDKTQPWNYGVGKSQGAYIYEVTPENGFVQKAVLSQLPATNITVDYGSSTNYGDYFVDRILRVDNSLFTLSNNQLNAYDLKDFKAQNKLTFKP